MFEKITLVVLMLLVAVTPAAAGDWSIIGSGHWIQKSGQDETDDVFTGTAADFDFDAGAGIGVGVLYTFSSRWGVEAKASFAQMDATVRTILSDAVFTLELGEVKAVPLTVVLQWRPLEREWNPYIGAGGAYMFLAGVEVPGSSQTVGFDATTGVVLNGGMDVELSKRWLVNLDLKYIPFETASEARSPLGPPGPVRFEPILASAGLRYRF